MRWAQTVAEYPISTIILGFVFVILASLPIKNIRITTNPVELWSAPTSQARIQKNYFDTHFAPFYRPTQVIIKNIDKEMFNYTAHNTSYEISSIFKKDFLLKVLKLQNEITSITADNGSIKLQDICFDPLANGKCVVQSVPEYFQANVSRLDFEDPDLGYNYLDHLISCLRGPYSPDDGLKPNHYSCLATYGGPALPNVVLGGFELKDGQPSIENLLKSGSLIITLVINNHNSLTENYKALAWEAKFLEFMKNLNSSEYKNLDVSYYSEV